MLNVRVEEFIKTLRHRPFEPFQIHLSGGTSYPVTHPDQVIVTTRAAYVGLDNNAEGHLAQDVAICDLLHIRRLGLPNNEKRRSRGKKRK